MRATFLIAGRELKAYFRSMSGYLIIAGVLFLEGLAFNVVALSAEKKSADVLGDFFYVSSGLTMCCAVLLSMRLIAEERQMRTLELLYCSPIRDGDIVLGKYLSALAFLGFFLFLTLPIPGLIYTHGKVTLGQIVTGYLGLLLVGSASLAIGTLGSALARTQVLAAILSGVLLVSVVSCWLLAKVTERPLSDFFAELSMYGHFKPFERGLLQLKHLAYFVLATYLPLFAATRVLEARRWR